MREVRAIAIRPDDSEVEVVLTRFEEDGEAPLRVRAALHFFRRIWVVDEDGREVEVIKQNAADSGGHEGSSDE